MFAHLCSNFICLQDWELNGYGRTENQVVTYRVWVWLNINIDRSSTKHTYSPSKAIHMGFIGTKYLPHQKFITAGYSKPLLLFSWHFDHIIKKKLNLLTISWFTFRLPFLSDTSYPLCNSFFSLSSVLISPTNLNTVPLLKGLVNPFITIRPYYFFL